MNIKNQRKLSFARSARSVGCETAVSESNVDTISRKDDSGLKKVEAFFRIFDLKTDLRVIASDELITPTVATMAFAVTSSKVKQAPTLQAISQECVPLRAIIGRP
jgi:hypothetical protein